MQVGCKTIVILSQPFVTVCVLEKSSVDNAPILERANIWKDVKEWMPGNDFKDTITCSLSMRKYISSLSSQYIKWCYSTSYFCRKRLYFGRSNYEDVCAGRKRIFPCCSQCMLAYLLTEQSYFLYVALTRTIENRFAEATIIWYCVSTGDRDLHTCVQTIRRCYLQWCPGYKISTN